MSVCRGRRSPLGGVAVTGRASDRTRRARDSAAVRAHLLLENPCSHGFADRSIEPVILNAPPGPLPTCAMGKPSIRDKAISLRPHDQTS